MNKGEFINYMAEKNNCTKVVAEKAIDMFTSSVTSAMSEGNEISLIGFGNFSISKVAARTVRDLRSGKAIEIPARNQPKFKVGTKLKAACNKS